MPAAEMRKQISLFLPLSDWKALRREAARRDMPMTELCRTWLKPHVMRLRAEETEPSGDQES